MKSAQILLKKSLEGIFIAILSLLAISSIHAQTLTFGSIDTSGGPVTGTALTNYLAGYGITISNVSVGTIYVVPGNSTGFPAPVGTNFINQSGSATGESYTLTFSQPVSDLSFLRGEEAGTNPPSTSSGIIYPQWTVTAFSGLTNLGSVGESLRSTFSDIPAQTFSLNYSGITSITIEGNAESEAGLGGPLLTDIAFTAPEPSTWVLLVSGLSLLALLRARSIRS